MQGSVDLVGRAIQLNAKDPLAHFHMGEALRALERNAEAAEHYGRTVALKPDFAEAHCARRSSPARAAGLPPVWRPAC
jgi:hypothetical protein